MKMLIELDKEDLVALVKGSSPNSSIMSHPIIKEHGTFNGSQDRWDWDYKLSNLTEEQLLTIYSMCKQSWK